VVDDERIGAYPNGISVDCKMPTNSVNSFAVKFGSEFYYQITYHSLNALLHYPVKYWTPFRFIIANAGNVVFLLI